MSYIKHILAMLCVVMAGPGIVRAQHFDVLVQQMGGRLMTGTADFDQNQWTLGRRVFFRDFDSDFAINNPGFNALGSGSPDLPAGSQALPGHTSLSWDFLPMTIDAVAQNLFYWNGTESDGQSGLTPDDVAFGSLPGPSYKLSLFDKSNIGHFVDGADVTVAGGVIEETAADGALHRHRFFFLEDGDGDGGTVPADGIYLLAMQLKMVGVESSLPVFMVFGTPGSSVAALDDAAVPWVEQRLSLAGDYNRNGVVDAADYAVWRDSKGQTGAGLAADGSGDQIVDQVDYDVWKANFGQAAELIVGTNASLVAGVRAAGVPEPSGLIMTVLALFGAAQIRASLRNERRAARRDYGSGPRWERSHL